MKLQLDYWYSLVMLGVALSFQCTYTCGYGPRSGSNVSTMDGTAYCTHSTLVRMSVNCRFVGYFRGSVVVVASPNLPPGPAAALHSTSPLHARHYFQD